MRVPTYDDQKINQAGIPDARVSLDYSGTNGEAIGQGLQQLGQGGEQLAQHVDRAMDLAAEVEATNAHTQFIHDATSAMHGTSAEARQTTSAQLAGVPGSGADATTGSGGSKSAAAGGDSGAGNKPAEIPPEGQLNAQGMNAVAASGHTLEYLGKRRTEIAAGLSQRAQKRFLESSGPQLEAFRTSIEDHTNQQIRVVAEESLKAFGATGLTTVANHYTLSPGDEQIVQSTLDAQTKRIQAVGASQGSAPEVIQARVETYRQQANATRLNQLIRAQDDEGAQALFAREKEHLDPDARGTFEGQITNLANQNVGMKVAKQAAVDGKMGTSGLTNIELYDSSIQKAADAAPPARRKAIEEEGERTKALLHNRNMSAVDNRFNSALSDGIKGGGISAVKPEDRQWMQDWAPKSWLALQADLARETRPGKAPEPTDAQKLDAWKIEQHLADAPADFKGVPVEQFQRVLIERGVPSKLRDGLVQRFIGTEKQVTNDKFLPGPLAKVVVETVGEAYPSSKGKPPTPEHARVGQAALDNATSKWRAFRAANPGKEPDPDQVREWAAEMTQPIQGSGMKRGEYLTNPESEGHAALEVGETTGAALKSGLDKELPPVPWDVKEALREQGEQIYGRKPNEMELRVSYRALMDARKAAASRSSAPTSTAPAQQDFTPPVMKQILGEPAVPATPAGVRPAPTQAKPESSPKPTKVHEVLSNELRHPAEPIAGLVQVPGGFATRPPDDRKGKK